MSETTFRIPLEAYWVPEIRFPLVRAVLTLWIRSGSRSLAPRHCRLDTGAAVSAFSLAEAITMGLVIPAKAALFGVETATGPVRQVRRTGRFQGKVLHPGGWDFDWPCHFVEHQGLPPKPVLGLAGVLDDLRITLDGSYSREAPHGWLILERRR